MNIIDSYLINLLEILDWRGNLSFIESENHTPFKIERCHWIYDVPGGEKRGGHAHKELKQLLIVASGSFDVILNGRNVKRTVTLNRPYHGMLIIPGIWRELNNFSSGSICLILASHKLRRSGLYKRFSGIYQI